jgi:hypothetical protein
VGILENTSPPLGGIPINVIVEKIRTGEGVKGNIRKEKEEKK